jgi:hypothetical protein
MRAGVSAMLLIGVIVAVVTLGGGEERSELMSSDALKQSLDWTAFDQQLHSDWVQRAKAHKNGMSSAEIALRERKEADERRMLAQKRLEVKKLAEEKEMEQLERNIELEASNQLAAHNTQLSDAIVQSAPQLQPQVVFEGHFQPGFDAKSSGEAAAELAAWGPGSNANWARVLAEQRKESMLRREGYAPQQQLATYSTIPQKRTAAMLTGPGSTSTDVLHEALQAESQLHAIAKTQDLANLKAAVMRSVAHPTLLANKKEDALTHLLAKYITKKHIAQQASANKAPVPSGHVSMSAALAGAALPAASETRGGKTQAETEAEKVIPAAETDADKVKELALEAQLAHEQAQNAILKEKLKQEQLKAAEAALAGAVLTKPEAVETEPAPDMEKARAAAPAQIASAADTANPFYNPSYSKSKAEVIAQKVGSIPIVRAKSSEEEKKWAVVMAMAKAQQEQQTAALDGPTPKNVPLLVSGKLSCCDDTCETISNHCITQPRVTFGVTRADSTHGIGSLPPADATSAPAETAEAAEAKPASAAAPAESAALSGEHVPKDATEKQLLHYLEAGTPAQKHEAAGLLYTETETHDDYHGEKTHETYVAPKKLQVQVQQQLIKPVKEVFVKGLRRCCDSSCNYVSTICPNTFALDHYAIELYAAGEGPSQSDLANELQAGTQVQKDQAAAVFYAIKHGLVAKEKKKLAAKNAEIRAASMAAASAKDPDAPVEGDAHADEAEAEAKPDIVWGSARRGDEHPVRLVGVPSTRATENVVGGSHGHTQTALQAGQVADEAASIVGDLTDEGH